MMVHAFYLAHYDAYHTYDFFFHINEVLQFIIHFGIRKRYIQKMRKKKWNIDKKKNYVNSNYHT